jgi:virulence-associated protein VagC
MPCHFEKPNMSHIARVFMSGRNQVIRLPEGLRLPGNQVRVERVGKALWVGPEPDKNQSLADWLGGFYASSEPLPESFLNDRSDPPLQRLVHRDQRIGE